MNRKNLHSPPFKPGAGFIGRIRAMEIDPVTPAEAGVQVFLAAEEPAPDSIRGRWIPGQARNDDLEASDGLFSYVNPLMKESLYGVRQG